MNAFADEGVCYDSIPNAESARGADSSCRAENGAVEIPRTREGRGRSRGKWLLPKLWASDSFSHLHLRLTSSHTSIGVLFRMQSIEDYACLLEVHRCWQTCD